MALAARVPSIPVVPLPGNICRIDVTTLFSGCGSIQLVNENPYSVDLHPSTICITPTQPATAGRAVAPPPAPPAFTLPPGVPTTFIQSVSVKTS